MSVSTKPLNSASRSRERTPLVPTELTLGLWVAAAAVWIVLATSFLPRQRVPGGDFMQFYTLGAAALAGEWALQYDWPAFHQRQTALVPTSADIPYRPSYPPLVAAVYAPFAALPFPAAYAAWAVTAAAVYLGLLAAASTKSVRLDARVALPAALLFPPFIALILAGQTTLLPLAGFVGGWMALERRRDVIAGLTFSLVALKPNFGIALACVLLLSRSWRIVVGVAAGVAVLAGATLLICGADAFAAWSATAVKVLSDPSMIEPDDTRHTHALRMTLESVAPRAVAFAVWLAVATVAVGLTLRTWQNATTPALRVAALLFATILISPHVLAYDAVLLAPACLWLADSAMARRQWLVVGGVIAIAVLFVVPHGVVLGVPLTVPLGLWLLSRTRGAPTTRSAVVTSSP